VLAQIYTRQVYELDDEVRNLKREGHTGATRSGLLRLAVELLLAMDIQSFYGHEATE
jgi:hypothetical protein